MTNSEYETLKREIIKEVSSADLCTAKLYFESCIQSRRSLSRVKTICDILFLLERRNVLHYNDVTPLLCMGKHLKNKKIVELSKAYKKLHVEDSETCFCGSTDTSFKSPNLIRHVDASVQRAINNIAHNIGPKWKTLARELDIKECYIDEIMEKYSSPYEQAMKALLIWKQKAGECATVEVLKEALESRFCKRKGLGLHILEPEIIIE